MPVVPQQRLKRMGDGSMRGPYQYGGYVCHWQEGIDWRQCVPEIQLRLTIDLRLGRIGAAAATRDDRRRDLDQGRPPARPLSRRVEQTGSEASNVIHGKMPTGKTITLDVESSDSIANVKEGITPDHEQHVLLVQR